MNGNALGMIQSQINRRPRANVRLHSCMYKHLTAGCRPPSAQISTQSHLISSMLSICADTGPTRIPYQLQHISSSELDGSTLMARIPTGPQNCEHLIDYFHFRLKAINCLLSPALPSLSLSLLVQMPAVLNGPD